MHVSRGGNQADTQGVSEKVGVGVNVSVRTYRDYHPWNFGSNNIKYTMSYDSGRFFLPTGLAGSFLTPRFADRNAERIRSGIGFSSTVIASVFAHARHRSNFRRHSPPRSAMALASNRIRMIDPIALWLCNRFDIAMAPEHVIALFRKSRTSIEFARRRF